MARLPLIEPEQATGDVARALAGLPVKLNIFRMMAHAESCLVPQMRLGTAILSRQKLGHRERELLVLLVAALENGKYEWLQHLSIAEGAGVLPAQIKAIGDGEIASSVFEEKDQALLAFAKEVVEKVRVREEIFLEVQKYFSDQEIVEAILAIGFYMTMTRLTEATETDLDQAGGMAIFDNLQHQKYKKEKNKTASDKY
ncbi:MAG: carboxymuconolactone decarboxylase family protein [Deltaproteobacteria bacterium]|nr:carboxymuconolactone decarboxylase family protein [Deltaproteobacteria bacterium]